MNKNGSIKPINGSKLKLSLLLPPDGAYTNTYALPFFPQSYKKSGTANESIECINVKKMGGTIF